MNKIDLKKITVLALLLFVTNLFAAASESGYSYQKMSEKNALLYVQGLYDAYSSMGILRQNEIDTCLKDSSGSELKIIFDQWLKKNQDLAGNSAGSLLLHSLRDSCIKATSSKQTEKSSQTVQSPATEESMADYMSRMQNQGMQSSPSVKVDASQAEARRKAELDARAAKIEAEIRAESVARQKAEQKARIKTNAGAQRQAELDARKKAETDAKVRAEAVAKQKAEQEIKLKADSEKQAQIATATSSDQGLTGRQILDEASKRHDQAYEYEVQEMTLIDKAGNKEQRKLRRFMREINDNETRYLSVFLSPSGVKGVGLLTWQHDNSADDQWLYLPAYGKKMKRIAKGGKKNYFMGTDYTYEDLVSESKDKFKYQRLADETVGGAKTFVIKAVAVHPSILKETGYSYRKLWLRQDNYVVIRIDFFDKRKRLLKRQKSSNLVNISGQIWRSNRSEIEQFIKKHKTITVIKSRSFKQSAVPEKNFRERTIVSGRVLR